MPRTCDGNKLKDNKMTRSSVGKTRQSEISVYGMTKQNKKNNNDCGMAKAKVKNTNYSDASRISVCRNLFSTTPSVNSLRGFGKDITNSNSVVLGKQSLPQNSVQPPSSNSDLRCESSVLVDYASYAVSSQETSFGCLLSSALETSLGDLSDINSYIMDTSSLSVNGQDGHNQFVDNNSFGNYYHSAFPACQYTAHCGTQYDDNYYMQNMPQPYYYGGFGEASAYPMFLMESSTDADKVISAGQYQKEDHFSQLEKSNHGGSNDNNFYLPICNAITNIQASDTIVNEHEGFCIQRATDNSLVLAAGNMLLYMTMQQQARQVATVHDMP
jgi:hypothetical protein